LHQQARVTHEALERLQQQEATGSHTAWEMTPPSLPTLLAPTVTGTALVVGAAVLLLAATLLLRRRPKHAETPAPDSPITEIPEPDKTYADSVPPPVLEGEDPDPWMPEPEPEVFNLEAAIHEVTRVRTTLAERREARALQREQDARKLDELALMEQTSPYFPFSVKPHESQPASLFASQPAPDAVDLELELETPEAIQPEPEPEHELTLAPTVASTAAPPTPPKAMAPTDDLHTLMEQDFAVTLALAQESEAVDLWVEARELATEVLQSDDPALRSQAHAMLARLDQLENEKALEQRLWGYTP